MQNTGKKILFVTKFPQFTSKTKFEKIYKQKKTKKKDEQKNNIKYLKRD